MAFHLTINFQRLEGSTDLTFLRHDPTGRAIPSQVTHPQWVPCEAEAPRCNLSHGLIFKACFMAANASITSVCYFLILRGRVILTGETFSGSESCHRSRAGQPGQLWPEPAEASSRPHGAPVGPRPASTAPGLAESGLYFPQPVKRLRSQQSCW